MRYQATVLRTREGAAREIIISIREPGDRPEAFWIGIAKGGVTMLHICFQSPNSRRIRVCFRVASSRTLRWGWWVLDELTHFRPYGYLDMARVLADMRSRPPHMHGVVTGRAAPMALVEVADRVTEMQDMEHPFRARVRAQAGVDL